MAEAKKVAKFTILGGWMLLAAVSGWQISSVLWLIAVPLLLFAAHRWTLRDAVAGLLVWAGCSGVLALPPLDALIFTAPLLLLATGAVLFARVSLVRGLLSLAIAFTLSFAVWQVLWGGIHVLYATYNGQMWYCMVLAPTRSCYAYPPGVVEVSQFIKTYVSSEPFVVVVA